MHIPNGWKHVFPVWRSKHPQSSPKTRLFLSWDRRKRVLPPLATSLSCCKCSGSDNQPVMRGNYSWDGVEWRSASTCTSHSAQLFLMAFHINAERQRNVDHKYSLLPIGCKSCHLGSISCRQNSRNLMIFMTCKFATSQCSNMTSFASDSLKSNIAPTWSRCIPKYLHICPNRWRTKSTEKQQ